MGEAYLAETDHAFGDRIRARPEVDAERVVVIVGRHDDVEVGTATTRDDRQRRDLRLRAVTRRLDFEIRGHVVGQLVIADDEAGSTFS